MEVRDHVCGMMLDEETAPEQLIYEGNTYYFCSLSCRHTFEHDAEQFVADIPQSTR